jgi:hypothetical protein
MGEWVNGRRGEREIEVNLQIVSPSGGARGGFLDIRKFWIYM